MADLAAGLGGLAVHVEVDVDVLDVRRLCQLNQLLVGAGVGAAQDVKHDGLRGSRGELEVLGDDVHDGVELGLVLAHLGDGLDGVVARVVWTGGDLVDHDGAYDS